MKSRTNTFGVRLADFGSSDACIPMTARGLKTKTTQLPGVTQEEEDARVRDILDKKIAELDEKKAAFNAASLKQAIGTPVEEADRRTSANTPKVRVKRAERQTGLRF